MTLDVVGAGEDVLGDAALSFLRRSERTSSGVSCIWNDLGLTEISSDARPELRGIITSCWRLQVGCWTS